MKHHHLYKFKYPIVSILHRCDFKTISNDHAIVSHLRDVTRPLKTKQAMN
jgi:hypothetical protein